MFMHDSTGIDNPTDKFQPVPKGEYLVKIISATEKVASSGNNMVVVDFVILEGPYAHRQIRFHNVVFLKAGEPGAFMSVHFRKCIGATYGGKDAVDCQTWIGRTLKADVGIEPGYGARRNQLYNKIERVNPAGTPASTAKLMPSLPEVGEIELE